MARRETDQLERAQDKAYAAMEARSSRRRVALAKEALAISPLCADAYAVLAEEASGLDEAIGLYRQGVEAGAATLGAAAFTDDVGLFWGLLETRPYMRARHGLAHSLWLSGARDEAVEHYEDMLRLNPNDNQGIRYSLIDALLALGREAAASALLKSYGDDASAAWAWSAALLAYRRQGDTARSRKVLAEAMEVNPHVADYLSGRKRLPKTLPAFIGLGDQDEAVAYVHDAGDAWAVADGAVAWMQSALSTPLSNSRAGRQTQADNGPEPDMERVDDAVLAGSISASMTEPAPGRPLIGT